jgi:hypothetical protein
MHESDRGIVTLKNHKRLSVAELRAIVEPIAMRYGVDRVYLFGSAARGDHKENSDYDFCIESGKIRDLFTLAGFFGELKDAIEHEIDLVTMESLSSDFLNNVMAEGVVLYG